MFVWHILWNTLEISSVTSCETVELKNRNLYRLSFINWYFTVLEDSEIDSVFHFLTSHRGN